jgi:protein-S-isoprenylcysteine O-methyltransferase Ste14
VRAVLPLLFVQVWASVALVATIVGILVGGFRLPARRVEVTVVARRTPATGTQTIWILGVFVATFWPIGILLAPMYAYHWPMTNDFLGSWSVQIFGGVLGTLGGLLFARSARAMGRQMTPAIQVQQGHQLLQAGPYRYIRHPVYTAIMASAVGQTLLYLSPVLGVLTAVLVGLAIYRAGLEEALLSSPEAFGGEYQAYMARTGRFLPRLREIPPTAR